MYQYGLAKVLSITQSIVLRGANLALRMIIYRYDYMYMHRVYR